MDIRLLIAINDVIGEKGADLTIPASSRTASENAIAAERALLDHAATKTSSTGRPIPETRGAAKDSATWAAAGGGAKSAGGGGMDAGRETVNAAGVQAQLITYGITGGVMLAEISARVLVRYVQLVRRDQKAARAAVATNTQAE
jgi:hypothetical protein